MAGRSTFVLVVMLWNETIATAKAMRVDNASQMHDIAAQVPMNIETSIRDGSEEGDLNNNNDSRNNFISLPHNTPVSTTKLSITGSSTGTLAFNYRRKSDVRQY